MLWIDRKAATVGTAFRERLEDQHGLEPAEAGSPDVLPRDDASQPQGGGGPERLDRKVLRLVPIERMGRDGLGREARGHVADRNLIVVEVEVHVTETS